MFDEPVSRLYPIIDTAVCAARGLDPRGVALACLRGGVRVLQLRAKSDSTAAFLTLAGEIVAAAASSGATVIVNDRADIARMAGAGGVHVGQDDLSVDDVRTVVGGQAVVGLSTHDREQIAAGLASRATYIAVGPLYQTATKDTGYRARGIDLVREACGRGKPVVAIGGITLETARHAIAAGASAVAVISDLLTKDPERRVGEYLRAIS